MKISVEPEHVLFPTTSYVIATNRNHVEEQAPPGRAAMIAAYAGLKPQFAQKKLLYRLGHGPTDGRLDWQGMDGYHFEAMWGKDGPYPYDDLRHGLREARALGADLDVVVNFGSGDAAEAGRLVSYLNRKDDPLRKSHGLPPFDVALFEIGNEMGWKTVRGHDQHAPSERAYAERALGFARAMRENSDIPIEVGATASINSNFTGDGWASGAEAVTNIIAIMGEDVDFITYHGYPSTPLKKPGDPLAIMAQNQWNRDKLSREIFPAIERSRRKYGISQPIAVGNTEYFTELYRGDYQRGVLEALYTADSIVTALALRLKAAINFCFMHDESPDSLFFENNDAAGRTAVFAVHELLARELGDEVVASSATDSETVLVRGGQADGDVALEKLAFVATRKADGALSLLLVNRVEEPVALTIDPAFRPRAARRITLRGSGYAAKAMTREEQEFTGAAELPPTSVSIVRFE